MGVTLTANEVSLRALRTLGLYQPGQPLAPDDGATCRMLIEELIDNWNTQALTVLTVVRTVYDLEAGRGGPDDPYTIGPGGDFDTGTAARPVAIRNANLLLNTASNYPTEIPLAILTQDMYAANPIKSILNAQPQTLYYNPTVPLGQIELWNIPNTDVNQLVLYTDLLTPQFVGGAVAYLCPPGYAKAFRLCVAAAIADFYGVVGDVAQRVVARAAEALTDIKLQNAPMGDLSLDPGFTNDRHGTYVIQTDQGA